MDLIYVQSLKNLIYFKSKILLHLYNFSYNFTVFDNIFLKNYMLITYGHSILIH